MKRSLFLRIAAFICFTIFALLMEFNDVERESFWSFVRLFFGVATGWSIGDMIRLNYSKSNDMQA